MSLLDHVKSALSLTVITLNLVFWMIVLVVLGIVKAIVPPVRPFLDGFLDRCYRLAVSVDDFWLRRVTGVRWTNPEIALPPDELCLVVSTHASWADILLLQSAIAQRTPPRRARQGDGNLPPQPRQAPPARE